MSMQYLDEPKPNVLLDSKKEDKYCLVSDYLINNQQSIYRLAYSYVKNRDYALDVVQQVAEKALKSSNFLRNTSFIKTWVYRIAVNESISFLRKNAKYISCEDYNFEDNPTNPDLATKLTLYMAINKLPPKLKTIIILKYFEGFKNEEIAQITKTNINTVKTRIRSALSKLKDQIKEV